MVKDSPIDLEPPAKEGKQVVVRKREHKCPVQLTSRNRPFYFCWQWGLPPVGKPQAHQLQPAVFTLPGVRCL
jgi:hypothetical protein